MLKQVKYQAGFLQQWNARLSNDITEPLVDKVVEAVLHDQALLFSHTSEYRNLYSYDKLWDAMMHYDPERFQNVVDLHLKAGLNTAFKHFAKPKSMEHLKPVSLMIGAQNLFAELSLKQTSSGLTAYGENKLEAFATGLDKAVKILTEGKSPAPCLAGVRTQRKGKTRLVWGYPLEMTILEATVARPVINHFKGLNHLMTFGQTSHEIGMRLRRSASRNRYHMSIDYSQFDASARPDMIHHAFSAIRTWFNPSDIIYDDITVNDVFRLIESYFINTPIVMPRKDSKYPTLVLGKHGGVPSGSYFTQFVDSFINAALIFSVSHRFQLAVNSEDIYVLGDDCLFFTNQVIGLDKISAHLSKYGYICHTDKGSSGLSTDTIEYLGRSWKNGFPIRTWADAVRGAIYPEKYRVYSALKGVRQMQALNVINSYLLTSYIEDAPVGIEQIRNAFTVTSMMTSGLTKFLMSEGLIPGKVFKRAIY